jgi:glycerophosphoryl diester phosphodiesterase
MKQVIGHRGAAGLALENSPAAISQAIKHKVASLEVDVRQTKDHRLVLCHDPDLKTMAGVDHKIAELNWLELKKIPLRDGSNFLLLEEALKLVENRPIIVEMKDGDGEEHLLRALAKFPKAQVTVASFKHSLLIRLREQKPDLPLYVLEHTDSLDGIQFAKRHKLQGMGLNFWLLSPVAYVHAKRANLDVYLYTVNNPFLAWFLHLLYPRAVICTDHPERFKHKKKEW